MIKEAHTSHLNRWAAGPAVSSFSSARPTRPEKGPLIVVKVAPVMTITVEVPIWLPTMSGLPVGTLDS